MSFFAKVRDGELGSQQAHKKIKRIHGNTEQQTELSQAQ